MPVGNASAELALELERVRDKLPELYALEDTFFNMVNARTKRDKVSYRPERIPFKLNNGTKGRVPNLDAGDLGRGGGPQFTYGSLAPNQKEWIIEWTKQSEIDTDSRVKSVADYAKEILKDHIKAAQNDMDSLIQYGDSADTVGVVATNNNLATPAFYTTGGAYPILYVDNATRFRQGADYDLYNGGPGTTITATVTIQGIDYGNKALYLSAAPATAPTNGAYLVFNNATAVVGSGINGILSLLPTNNTGTYMGVNRAAFPGNFNTSAVNANSTTLTPAIARLLLNTLLINAQVDAQSDKSQYIFLTDIAQKAAWENTGINVTQNIQAGNSTGRDMLPSQQVETIGGIRLMASRKGIPGRINLLNLSTWFVSEVQPLDYYAAGSVETFWPMGASGGVAASFLKYMIWVGNIGCDNPRDNAVLYGLNAPQGY
jgi:hypothetical protein